MEIHFKLVLLIPGYTLLDRFTNYGQNLTSQQNILIKNNNRGIRKIKDKSKELVFFKPFRSMYNTLRRKL